MKRRILLTGGGTGGSVTPLLALAQDLRTRDSALEFLFVGSHQGPEASLCAAADIPFQAIPAGKLRRYWSWQNISDLGNLWRAWRAARKIIQRWPPDVVVSAGSFVAVPVVWAARRSGSRIVIHQQDVRPGLANKLMAASADVITVSFDQSRQDFPASKVRLIGNPVRPEILTGSVDEARRLFSLAADIPTLLVVGGGTGSQAINQLIIATAPRLVQTWQILHITGDRAFIPSLEHERYHYISFLTKEYPDALAVADLVVSRCGLGAMTELAALGKPTIFVPMPQSHQEDNARVIRDNNAGLVVAQADLSDTYFIQLLGELMSDRDRLAAWARNISALARPDALKKMSELILHLSNS